MAYSKFGNTICYYKGMKFHSKGELKCYQLLMDHPKVATIDTQTKFKLATCNFMKNPLWYQADFVVTSTSGKEYVIEFKGKLERAALYKMAYFEYVYKKKVHMVWNKKTSDGFDISFIE